MISPMVAAKAYAAAQGAGVGGAGAAGPAADSAGAAFSQMLKSAVDEAVSASKHSEKQMAAHVQGKAELVDVVTAVASAEASLETVMAVRDQVIAAYQEIMRMPI
ncbi:MAG TPA: flagellar hook-basal body complex protein FliE [Caulobacteraceae bacterium]|jgi:flagellar hook-basal body complex protein FliE|nr:flagellar hook-basal body complex protein FliE [Caulobacteraceae bacterium]